MRSVAGLLEHPCSRTPGPCRHGHACSPARRVGSLQWARIAMGSLHGLLEGQKWAELVKALDAALPAAGGDRRQLLLNRAFCLQQLGLLRKALKVGGPECVPCELVEGWALPGCFQPTNPAPVAASDRPGAACHRAAAAACRRRLPPAVASPPICCIPAVPSMLLTLQDYEAVLEDEPAHVNALLHKAKVLVALRQGEVRPGWVDSWHTCHASQAVASLFQGCLKPPGAHGFSSPVSDAPQLPHAVAAACHNDPTMPPPS